MPSFRLVLACGHTLKSPKVSIARKCSECGSMQNVVSIMRGGVKAPNSAELLAAKTERQTDLRANMMPRDEAEKLVFGIVRAMQGGCGKDIQRQASTAAEERGKHLLTTKEILKILVRTGQIEVVDSGRWRPEHGFLAQYFVISEASQLQAVERFGSRA